MTAERPSVNWIHVLMEQDAAEGQNVTEILYYVEKVLSEHSRGWASSPRSLASSNLWIFVVATAGNNSGNRTTQAVSKSMRTRAPHIPASAAPAFCRQPQEAGAANLLPQLAANLVEVCNGSRTHGCPKKLSAHWKAVLSKVIRSNSGANAKYAGALWPSRSLCKPSPSRHWLYSRFWEKASASAMSREFSLPTHRAARRGTIRDNRIRGTVADRPALCASITTCLPRSNRARQSRQL